MSTAPKYRSLSQRKVRSSGLRLLVSYEVAALIAFGLGLLAIFGVRASVDVDTLAWQRHFAFDAVRMLVLVGFLVAAYRSASVLQSAWAHYNTLQQLSVHEKTLRTLARLSKGEDRTPRGDGVQIRTYDQIDAIITRA